MQTVSFRIAREQLNCQSAKVVSIRAGVVDRIAQLVKTAVYGRLDVAPDMHSDLILAGCVIHLAAMEGGSF